MFGRKQKAEETQEAQVKSGKRFSSVVVSDKMQDTVVVKVERYYKHTKYEKFIKEQKRYKAHNPGNTKKIGDKVEIQEVRPISKDKHFIVL